MPINIVNLGASANPDINLTTNVVGYSGTSWTPPNVGLLVLDVFSSVTAGNPEIPRPAGNGLIFLQIQTVLIGSSAANRLTRFGANLTGSFTGILGINFVASQLRCAASVKYVSGTNVDLSNGVTGAFVQSPINSATAGVTGSVVLNAAGSSGNRVIVAFAHQANEASTPKSGWTELDDLANSAPVTALETQFRGDAFDTLARATWATSAGWGGIASEIKETSSPPTNKFADETEGVSILETSSVQVGILSSETENISILESPSDLSVTVSKAEIESVAIVESASSVYIVSLISETENVNISDTSLVNISSNASETENIGLSEFTSIQVILSPNDTLGISIAESSFTSVFISPNESENVVVSEGQTSISITSSKSETLNINLSESSSIVVSGNVIEKLGGDGLSLGISDISTVSISSNQNDSVSIQILESSLSSISSNHNEVENIEVLDSSKISISSTSIDVESLSLLESASITIFVSSMDNLQIHLSDVSSLVITIPIVYTVTAGIISIKDTLQSGISTKDEKLSGVSSLDNVVYNITTKDN